MKVRGKIQVLRRPGRRARLAGSTKMAVQRSPYVAVDVQLEDFEHDLRNQLEFHLIVAINREYWMEHDHISADDERGIEDVIDFTFQSIIKRYENANDVTNVLQHFRILIQNVVWSSMNVPWPRDPNNHASRVVHNALEVFYKVIYDHLRTEMIMANHHCEVLQRTWRKCYYEPHHPICKRRLLRQFEDIIS